jgi:hypothetical protein
MTVSRIDILVENQGSVVLLRPGTTAGREWLEANCDWSGYQPFTGGTLLCKPRYGAAIVGAPSRPGWRLA